MNPFDDTSRVAIADIVRPETWQVRQRVNRADIKRYAATYKAGGDMEPVRLARVASVLMLIDGAHRLDALLSIGDDTVAATITTMKEQEAQWAAASANLSHGRPLNSKELREVFRRYVATGQHRVGRGRVKSLADIAKDIPGKTRYTFRNWMMADYPQLYRKHYEGSGGSGHSHGGIDHEPRDQQAFDLKAIEAHLRQVEALAATLKPTNRRRTVARVEILREALLK